MVPNPRNNETTKILILRRTLPITQACNFFDFLTNDDDVKAKYLGGMNNYNYRQYKDGD